MNATSRKPARFRAALATASAAVTLWLLGLAINETSGAPPAPATAARSSPGEAAGEPSSQPSETDQAPADTQPANAKPTPGRMSIHAVDATTDEPLAQVQLRLQGRVAGQALNQFLETDDEGIAQATWPADAVVQSLSMTASKPTFVPMHYRWLSDQAEIVMPARLDLRFQPGTVIAGTVQDEAGRPIVGATVKAMLPITWPRLANHAFYAAPLTTDERGNWQWTDAPADRSAVSMGVSHPDYLPGSSPLNAGENNIAVLKQGYRLVGRVVGPDGNAVAAADVRLGFNRFNSDKIGTNTDAEGRFVLRNCKPGKSLVTVQAGGFAPALQEVTINDQTGNLQIQLQPGHVLSVKVVDPQGRPINGVAVFADTWRGFRSLELSVDTNAEGMAVWPNAPDDVVLCDVLTPGYMSARRTPLKAGPDLHTITLHPELVIRGRVTDADTGKPIERFGLRDGLIFAGRKEPRWSRDEPTPYTAGAYLCKFSEGYDGHVLEIVADGYLPTTSRIFLPTEGSQTFDFALKPGKGPTGVVLLPDGSPARAAEVALATKARRAVLQAGGLSRDQTSAAMVTTDAEGRFSFPPPGDEAFMIIVVHEAGFAKRLGSELDEGPIKLEAWGRVEGLVLLGTRPDAGRKVNFQPDRSKSDGTFFNTYGYQTTTDEQGQFTFERVMPGRASVGRGVIIHFRSGSQHSYGWQVPVEVAPDAAVKVVIGGAGRPVVGRVAVKEGVKVDWATNMPAAIDVWDKEAKKRIRVAAVATIDETGRFELPDVPAGDYVLSVPVHEPPEANEPGSGRMVGAAHLEFTVPEIPGGRSDEPLDLGVIEASMFGKRS